MAKKKNERRKFHVLPPALALLAGLVAAWLVAVSRGFALGQPAYLSARYWSDGFFASGLLITGVGLLIWISTTGFFDIMGYGFRSLLVLFTALKNPKEHQSFYDYKTMRDAKRGKPLYSLVIVGAALLLLSAACLGLYYNLPS